MDCEMLTISNNIGNFKLSYKLFNDVVYFKGKEIASILGYSNTGKAVIDHVNDDYKHKLKDISTIPEMGMMAGSEHNIIYLTEPGLYQLIFKSHLPIAKDFTKWVFEELLPTIRSTGAYIPQPITKQIFLKNETDLHYKVIHFIKNHYPDIILTPGLGEYQTTSTIRCDALNKGYIGGQPDIIINSPHKSYSGFAIELKTPKGNGKLSDNQQEYLKKLKIQNHKILVSDDYDAIIIELIEYFRDVRFKCGYCIRQFKSLDTLANHHKIFHRINKQDDILFNGT